MSDKLKELHGVLAEELLKRVKDPEAKSGDLNVARQFLRDNGIDAVPTQDKLNNYFVLIYVVSIPFF